MYQKSIILLVLLVSSLFANEKKVVLFRSNKYHDRTVEKVMNSHFPENITVVREKPALSQSAIRQVILTKPDYMVFLDSESAAAFYRYQAAQRSEIPPSVVISGCSNYSTYSKSLPRSSVYGVLPSLDDMSQNIMNSNPSLTSIGVLYTSANRPLVAEEAALMKKSGKTVQTVPLNGAVSSSQIQSGLKAFSSDKKTILWLVGSEMSSFITGTPDIVNDLKRRFGAIITEERAVAEALKSEIPVLHISRDPETIGSLITARIAMSFHNDSNVGKGDMKIAAYYGKYYNGSESERYAPGSSALAGQLVTRAITLLAENNKEESADEFTSPETTGTDSTTLAASSLSDTAVIIDSSTTETTTEKVTIAEEPVKAKVKKTKASKKQITIRDITRKKPKKSKVKKKPLRRVTITASIANVFSKVSPEPLIMAVAKAGDEFVLLDSMDTYLKIKAWGKVGFIHTSEVAELVPKEPESNQIALTDLIRDPRFIGISSSTVGAMVLAVLIMIFMVRRRRLRRLQFRSALLLSKKPLILHDTEKSISLKEFLAQSGTELVKVTSPASLQRRMARHMPDIIIVDWDIHGDVASILEKQLEQYRLSSATTVLFYNVHEKEQSELTNRFGDAELHVFPSELSEQALSMILAGQGKAYESGESESLETGSYLAGIIHGNSLGEILQLIETGRKDGCLVIEDDDPFAAIFFKQGTIVNATTRNDQAGVAAIYEVLQKEIGSFYFMLDREAPQETISVSVMAILMEWSSQQDQKEMRKTAQQQAITETM